MLRCSGLFGLFFFALSCATPVKTKLGEIHPAYVTAAERVIETLKSMHPRDYVVYQTDYKNGSFQEPWLRQKFYAANAPLEDIDFPLLSRFLTAEQKITHKAIFTKVPEAKRNLGTTEDYKDYDHPGTYVYYYDPSSKAHVNGYGNTYKLPFAGKPWESFYDVRLSYAVISQKDSEQNLFKGIYHAFTGETNWREGFDSREGIEITQIDSPGILEGYAFLHQKTGREFLLYRTANEIILIRVEANLYKQKSPDRLEAYYAILTASKRQEEIFLAANKPLNKCDTASNRKRCDEEQLAEAERQQEANRQRANEIYWENWWRNATTAKPTSCSTIYGTPKDGIQTNVTTCK